MARHSRLRCSVNCTICQWLLLLVGCGRLMSRWGYLVDIPNGHRTRGTSLLRRSGYGRGSLAADFCWLFSLRRRFRCIVADALYLVVLKTASRRIFSRPRPGQKCNRSFKYVTFPTVGMK